MQNYSTLSKKKRKIIMKQIQTIEQNSASLLSALIVHAVTLSLLFLSFVPLPIYEKPDLVTPPAMQPNLQSATPVLNAPVVLYHGPVSSGATQKQPDQATLQKDAATKNTTPKQTKQIKATVNNKQLQELVAQITQEPSATTLTQETKHEPVPELFKAAPDSNTSPEQETGSIRRRQLTLADLFRTLPHVMKKLSGESGDGDQLVVVQGDMNYYGFLKNFLEHINQVFAFHGGPAQLLSYAKSGKITQNAGLSVVIDRQGNLISKQLRHSFGHTDADALILKTVDMASPFPPVPSHIQHKTVRVELISVIQ